MASLTEKLLVPADLPEEAQAYLKGLYGFEKVTQFDDKLDISRLLGYIPLQNDQLVQRFLKHVYKYRAGVLSLVTADIYKINPRAFSIVLRIVDLGDDGLLKDLFAKFVGTDVNVKSGDDRNCPLEVSESAHHETQRFIQETFKAFAALGPLPATGFKGVGWTCGALLAFATLYSKSGIDAGLKEIAAFGRRWSDEYYNELMAPLSEYYEGHAALYLQYLLQIEHPAFQEKLREHDLLINIINEDKIDCLHTIIRACPERSAVLLEESEEPFLNRVREKYEEAYEEFLRAEDETDDESDDEDESETPVDKHAHLKTRVTQLHEIYVWAGGKKKSKRDAEEFVDSEAKVHKGDDEDTDDDANDDDVYEDDEDEEDAEEDLQLK